MLSYTALSQQFPGVSSISVLCKRMGGPPKNTRLIRLHATASGFFEILRTLTKDNREFQKYADLDRSSTWAGFASGETPRKFIEAGFLPSALEAVKKAAGKLSAPLVRAAPQPSYIGAAFNVGRIVQGHPKPCYTRPRAKLPAKTLDFWAGYSAYDKAETLAPVFAAIARSVADYTLQGGVVTVRLNRISGFALPNEGHDGCFFSIDIPIGNLSALSAVCSVTFDRALCLRFAQVLSGKANDSLPVLHVAGKVLHQITGKPAEDRATLKSLSIVMP